MKEKSAFISIIGRPNVGKSSLMNCILGQKVAIVSNKPQNTRTKIMGIYTREETQLVFIDTPGFHKPRNELDRNMNKAVGDGMADVDAAVLVVAAVTKFKSEDGSLPPAELELIKAYSRVFGKGKVYHYYIFSKSGFTKGLTELAQKGDVTLVTLDDMYAVSDK